MRNPNGYGGVVLLPGRRRRPYRARVTVGWQEREGKAVQQYLTIGYYETRKDALVALAQYNCTPWDVRRSEMTFREVYEEWSPRHFAQYTSSQRVIESTMNHCKPLWNRQMKELRTAELQRFMDSLSGLSRAYQLKVRSLLHMQFDWCMKNDILFRDYSRYIEVGSEDRQTKRRVFSREEIQRLWSVCEKEGHGIHEPPKYQGSGLADSLLILLYTGARVGELLNLKWEHIDLKKRCINLQGTKTKAARRLVPLHRDILPVLERAKARGGDWVVSYGGKPLTYSQYKYSWFDKVMKELKFEHTPHDTRHTFVSGLDTAGVPRTTIKFIVGHSLSSDVTDRYTHKALPELIKAVDKLKY